MDTQSSASTPHAQNAHPSPYMMVWHAPLLNASFSALTCTPMTRSNNEHICKHIHKVHSLVVRNRKEAERYTESMSSTAMTQESEAPPWHGRHGGNQHWWNWDCIHRINFQSSKRLVTIKYYSSNSNPPWIWTPLFKCIPRYLNTQIWNNYSSINTAVSIYIQL